MHELEEAYIEYLYEHFSIGNGTMLINKMENGYLLEDFLDSIDMTIDEYEGLIW